MIRPPPRSPLFPYTPLSRSVDAAHTPLRQAEPLEPFAGALARAPPLHPFHLAKEHQHVEHAHLAIQRSEEHTSELQSPCNLVCRLLLEKKKQRVRILLHGIT